MDLGSAFNLAAEFEGRDMWYGDEEVCGYILVKPGASL
jgi:hypothetical protein